MTEDRPRPQYGEYATPEQQASAMGLPEPSSSPRGVPDSAPSSSPPTPPVADGARPSSARRLDGAAEATPAQRATARRATARTAASLRWDRVFTYALLGLATYSLLTSIPQYLDFGTAVNDIYAQLGAGTFNRPDLMSKVGIGFGVVQTILYVFTVLFALRALRARKLAFYIPLIGGMLFLVITAVVLGVVLSSDPGFLEHIRKQNSGF